MKCSNCKNLVAHKDKNGVITGSMWCLFWRGFRAETQVFDRCSGYEVKEGKKCQ